MSHFGGDSDGKEVSTQLGKVSPLGQGEGLGALVTETGGVCGVDSG